MKDVDKIIHNGKEYYFLFQGEELIYRVYKPTPPTPVLNDNAYLHIENDGARFDFDYAPNRYTSIRLRIQAVEGRDDTWYAVLYAGAGPKNGDNFRGFGIRTRHTSELRLGCWNKENVATGIPFDEGRYLIHMGTNYISGELTDSYAVVSGKEHSYHTDWQPNFTYESSIGNFVLGSWNKDGVNRPILGYYGRFTIDEYNMETGDYDVVRDYYPVLDKDNKPCYYDRITKQYFYPTVRENTKITYGVWDE